MSVYFISDTHFGHPNIHETFRTRFTSIEDHDNHIVDRILTTCSKRDSLYILGDVVIHRNSLWCLTSICSHIEHVRIILGNHDLEPRRQNNPTLHELLSTGISSIHGAMRYKESWLTHIPIHESEFINQKFNIHGHNHIADFLIEDDRYINVACEIVDYTPVEYTKLIQR